MGIITFIKGLVDSVRGAFNNDPRYTQNFEWYPGSGGGGGDVTKAYVDQQDAALQNQINGIKNGTSIDSFSDVEADLEAIDAELELKADKAETYTKTEVDDKLDEKLSATGVNKGLTIIDKKVGHSNSITVPTAKRILQATYDAQGHLTAIATEFNWSNTYNTSADNQLFTRKGANDMYVNYLKSTNGTLIKQSVITNDYSHYVKCGNIYQLSIGFQNSSDIANNTTMFTLPETISNSSIEMYIVVSNTAGDTRILQCGGGGTAGNIIKAKQAIPSGYWFGTAIFIKL